MPKYNKYFVIEYRLPIQVDDVSSIPEAVSRAKRIVENRFGFAPDNWNARVFEYDPEADVVGHVKEYFYNPHSASFREITKNLEYHKDMVEKGIDPSKIEGDEDAS
jgi:hypothetical protein